MRIEPLARGMVTFELAIGILTATLMTAVLAWCASLVALQARCTDTATAVVAQLARGDVDAAAVALEAGPSGARMEKIEQGSTLTVTISASAEWGRLGPVTVEGSASMPVRG